MDKLHNFIACMFNSLNPLKERMFLLRERGDNEWKNEKQTGLEQITKKGEQNGKNQEIEKITTHTNKRSNIILASSKSWKELTAREVEIRCNAMIDKIDSLEKNTLKAAHDDASYIDRLNASGVETSGLGKFVEFSADKDRLKILKSRVKAVLKRVSAAERMIDITALEKAKTFSELEEAINNIVYYIENNLIEDGEAKRDKILAKKNEVKDNLSAAQAILDSFLREKEKQDELMRRGANGFNPKDLDKNVKDAVFDFERSYSTCVSFRKFAEAHRNDIDALKQQIINMQSTNRDQFTVKLTAFVTKRDAVTVTKKDFSDRLTSDDVASFCDEELCSLERGRKLLDQLAADLKTNSRDKDIYAKAERFVRTKVMELEGDISSLDRMQEESDEENFIFRKIASDIAEAKKNYKLAAKDIDDRNNRERLAEDSFEGIRKEIQDLKDSLIKVKADGEKGKKLEDMINRIAGYETYLFEIERAYIDQQTEQGNLAKRNIARNFVPKGEKLKQNFYLQKIKSDYMLEMERMTPSKLKELINKLTAQGYLMEVSGEEFGERYRGEGKKDEKEYTAYNKKDIKRKFADSYLVADGQMIVLDKDHPEYIAALNNNIKYALRLQRNLIHELKHLSFDLTEELRQHKNMFSDSRWDKIRQAFFENSAFKDKLSPRGTEKWRDEEVLEELAATYTGHKFHNYTGELSDLMAAFSEVWEPDTLLSAVRATPSESGGDEESSEKRQKGAKISLEQEKQKIKEKEKDELQNAIKDIDQLLEFISKLIEKNTKYGEKKIDDTLKDFKKQLDSYKSDLLKIDPENITDSDKSFISNIVSEQKPIQDFVYMLDTEFGKIEIAESQKGKRGFFGQLWKDTTFLSLADMFRMWNDLKEYIKSQHEVRSGIRASNVAKKIAQELTDIIPDGLKYQKRWMDRYTAHNIAQAQKYQDQEVNQWKENWKNVDEHMLFDPVSGVIATAQDINQTKALILMAAEQYGILDFGQEKFQVLLGRVSGRDIYSESQAMQAYNDLYGTGEHSREAENLKLTNENTRHSKMKEYQTVWKQMQGPGGGGDARKRRWFDMLNKNGKGRYINPNDYAGGIEYSILDGKNTDNEIIYLILRGVREGFLSQEYANYFANTYDGDMATLDCLLNENYFFDYINREIRENRQRLQELYNEGKIPFNPKKWIDHNGNPIVITADIFDSTFSNAEKEYWYYDFSYWGTYKNGDVIDRSLKFKETGDNDKFADAAVHIAYSKFVERMQNQSGNIIKQQVTATARTYVKISETMRKAIEHGDKWKVADLLKRFAMLQLLHGRGGRNPLNYPGMEYGASRCFEDELQIEGVKETCSFFDRYFFKPLIFEKRGQGETSLKQMFQYDEFLIGESKDKNGGIKYLQEKTQKGKEGKAIISIDDFNEYFEESNLLPLIEANWEEIFEPFAEEANKHIRYRYQAGPVWDRNRYGDPISAMTENMKNISMAA